MNAGLEYGEDGGLDFRCKAAREVLLRGPREKEIGGPWRLFGGFFKVHAKGEGDDVVVSPGQLRRRECFGQAGEWCGVVAWQRVAPSQLSDDGGGVRRACGFHDRCRR
ncbi:hypothetical protein HAX54_048990 [Datura stramonium]|uniref:Uncharacterized protein n=1 Tax=Datura stramonium TaxID=4076 RepID=A0ABS8WJZ3_DATST|nr:hypothetical protein [Datura stramonium]